MDGQNEYDFDLGYARSDAVLNAKELKAYAKTDGARIKIDCVINLLESLDDSDFYVENENDIDIPF